MSASSKKKLRKEQQAAQLTEKQLKEQAESKKLKTYSVIFIVAIVAIAITAIAVFGVTTINRTGLIEKNTVAATIDGEKLNSVEMNYYFVDAVNKTYREWSSMYGDSVNMFASMMGLNVNQPLDQQVYNEEDGSTWADYFYEVALEQAKSDIALCNMAEAEGFELPEEEKANLEASMNQVHAYMTMAGYADLDDFYRTTYGNGADVDSYWEYALNSALAAAYYNAYADALTYENDEIRAFEAENYDRYTSYTYASYYVSYNSYLEGGTTNEDGTITYSDAEKDAARAKAKEVADHLAATGGVDALDSAIAALPVNADVENAASSKYEDYLYSYVSSSVIDWLSDDARKEGDMVALENAVTTTDEDGNETSSVNGYYVVVFQGANENLRPLANVRHLLVNFESDDGTTNYTDEDKAEAYAKAEAILNEWKAGEATEESFIALVKEKSEDAGSASTGGLFEDVTPQKGIYVEAFTDWAVDENRVAGETGIIETEYGCHIMYYVGDDELTYRDYMIISEMKQQDVLAWYDEVVAKVSVTEGNTSKLLTDMVLAA